MSAAAGALTALVTQDAQSGTIDQQAAQQVGSALSDIVNSYEMGHTADAQHKLADLSQQITMLEQRGSITPGAAPALAAAVANLGTALANAPSDDDADTGRAARRAASPAARSRRGAARESQARWRQGRLAARSEPDRLTDQNNVDAAGLLLVDFEDLPTALFCP